MTDEDAGRSQGRTSDDTRESRGRESRERESRGRESRGRDRERTRGPRDPRLDREQSLDREDAFDREAARRNRASDEDESAGLGFSLPPISLPAMHLPERIRLVFPAPDPPEKVSKPTRVRVSWVLLAVVLADALDALAVGVAGPDALAWVRAALGTLLAATLVGGPGLLYAWELLAILGGFGALSLAPTLTALVLGRILLSESA